MDYAGAVSERQPPMYFRLGGGTLKGVSKPGEIVWSRIFVEDGTLKADIGRAQGGRAAARGDGAPLADYDAAVAHHARGAVRRDARSDDGAAQVESRPGGLRAGRGGRQKALAVKAAFFREAGLDVSVCGTETGL